MRDDFYLTDEQRAMRDLVRAVARDRVARQAAQVDETEAYPAEQIELLGKQGLMGLYIPEAYGGSAMGTLAFCIAVEEIAWACASTAVIYLVQYAGGWPIVAAGSDAQKRRYLPRLASGEITAAVSLSESGAGSDAAAISTNAVRRGDRYILDGQKLWGANGSAGSSASRSPPSRGCSSCSPTWRCRSTARDSSSITPRRSSTTAPRRRPSKPPWRSASRPMRR